MDGFINCTIALIDEKYELDGADYNWYTNEDSGSTPVILWTGPAQAQIYRFTLTMDAPVGAVDQVRTVRFTVDAPEVQGLDIRKGMQVRVLEAPLNPSLVTYQFVVNSGLNSGIPFRRTIETEVDMGRVLPALVIPEPDPGPDPEPEP